MALVIPDDVLRDMNLDERQARIEIACRLFDGGKLHLWPAAKLAGLSRGEMEEELMRRGIAVYRCTPDQWQDESEALKRLGW